jgi:hypothetical protein
LDISEAEERLRAYLLESIGTQILWAYLAYELAYGEVRDVPKNHGVPGSSPGPATLKIPAKRKKIRKPVTLS